jgi:hypothetical protein
MTSPPSGGQQHSPADGCGWGVFVVGLNADVYRRVQHKKGIRYTMKGIAGNIENLNAKLLHRCRFDADAVYARRADSAVGVGPAESLV